MSSFIKAAFGFYTLGALMIVVCLVKTTPITMSAFFFIGLPSFAAGMISYILFVASQMGLFDKAGDKQ